MGQFFASNGSDGLFALRTEIRSRNWTAPIAQWFPDRAVPYKWIAISIAPGLDQAKKTPSLR